MSLQRFTPKFKAEAVRQVIEREYFVAETAERLGVSTHSLYKCVKPWGLTKPRNSPASCTKPKARFYDCGQTTSS